MIVRPLNLLIIALTMLVVLYKFTTENVDDYWFRSIFLIIPAILTAAAGYVINDIFDVETDKLNKLHMVVVGTYISKKNAWILYAVLTVLSLVVSYGFNLRYLEINACITVMLALYAFNLKGLPLIGNLIVAMCSASVIGVCLLIASFDTKTGLLNFSGYIIFAFFTSLIREIVKDLQDMQGDSAMGLKTYAIVAGEKGAKILVYVLVGFLILLCGIYTILALGVGMYLSGGIMAIITGSLFYFINHLANAKTPQGYLESSKFMKYVMVVGIINLLVG